MSHTCAGALVRCMDFRLESEIEDWLNSKGLCDQTDIISVAGAAKLIAQEENSFVEGQVDLSKKLHAIHTLTLMNHTDCGGYGGRAAFASTQEEHDAHVADLRKAKEKIAAKYPDLTITLALANVDENNKVSIEEVA